MTGHAFQILLTDADALAVLETMRSNLKESGTVAFEIRNPRIDWAREWSERTRLLRLSTGEQFLERLEIIGQNGEFISFQTSYRWSDGRPRPSNDAHVTLTTSSTLRFPSQEHVEDLIARSGLAIRDVFGDWNAGPFEAAHSREIIFVVGHSSP